MSSMKDILLFSFCLFFIIASALAGFAGNVYLCIVGSCAVVFLLVWIWRSIALQLRTIRTGMDLLRSHDFASRLRPVGQREADSMVELYNSLMANMKSERLRALEQHHFLSKLIDASPMGVAVCNFDGTIESANDSFVRMRSPEIDAALTALRENEFDTVRCDSQIFRCSRMFFMDRGFKRTFYLVERLTDEILQAETEMFHKIVRTMGHEVNNTLGGVISVLESVSALHAGDKDIEEVVDGCSDSCRRLGAFVKAYADVVKLPSPELASVELNGFVDETLPFLRAMCPPDITLEVVKTAQNVCVDADCMLLQRVLINGVKNAVESIGGRSGKIILRVSERTLELIDNGPGLTAEAEKRVFTPFFSTKNPDRGLGLMLIAEILRRHQAAFSLSTRDGLTTLRITFPQSSIV